MKKEILLIIVFISFISPMQLISQLQRQYIVVLDAGHGGKDPGNLGNGYREKKVALNVVLAIGKELSKSSDIKVIYTRKTDRFIELHNRARIANSSGADLFVSVHCDSFGKEKVHGAGTFVLGLKGNNANLEIVKRENSVILLEDNYEQNYDYDPNSPESVIGLSVLQEENLDASLAFASLVQDNFIKAKRYDRSVKQANFLVLRQTAMPSVLIELGFLTNKAEGRFLNTKKGQLKMASAVAKAIKKYIDQLKLNTVGEISGNTKKTPKQTPKKVPEKIAVTKEAPKKDVKEPEDKKVVAKNEKPAKKPAKKIVKAKTKAKKSGIEFKVQIAASRRKLPLKPYNFKGLKDVEMIRFDGYYKYYYGTSPNYRSIKEIQQDVRRAGIKDAFIVSFKNGVKIPLREALKSQ